MNGLKRLAIIAGLFGGLTLAAYLAAPAISLNTDGGTPTRPSVQTQTQTQTQPVFQYDRLCMPRRNPTFNAELEYTCAFEAFKAMHIDLVDQAKMDEFTKKWDPAQFKGTDAFKTQESTYKLMRQMRDGLRNRQFPDHNVFDYVNSPRQVKMTQDSVVRPVLQGGIGAMVKLNNDWQIRESVTNSRPDPKAPFKDAEEAKAFAKKMEESMIIGPGHELMVEAPVKNSPSWGKLQDNDFITHINGESLNGKTLNQAVSMLRGTPGTTIKVKIQRNGVELANEIDLTRAVFDQHAVTYHDINGIRHINVQNFTADNLLEDFYDALKGAADGKMKGVNVNLRGNPGGRLDYVIAMLEMVVPKGQILTQHHRVPGEMKVLVTEYVLNDDYLFATEKALGSPAPSANPSIEARVDYTPAYGRQAMGNPGFIYSNPLKVVIPADMPLTVEINGDSYSASEIFAGAVQFTGRGTILGQPSPGKGVVMTQLPLPDRGNLSVTSGRYFPGGTDTENVGILPHQTIEQPEDFGKTDAIRAAATAEIEKLYAELVRRRELGTTRTKINLDHFNEMLDRRDEADQAKDHDSGQ